MCKRVNVTKKTVETPFSVKCKTTYNNTSYFQLFLQSAVLKLYFSYSLSAGFHFVFRSCTEITKLVNFCDQCIKIQQYVYY